MIFINKSQAGVKITAQIKMKNLKEKERKAIHKEIVQEVSARYECFCDVDELASKKLFNSIMKLLERRDEPIDVALATLKKMIWGIYSIEVIEEMGLELDEF